MFGRPERLADHFRRHGPGVGAATEGAYVRTATDLLARARADRLPTKVDADGIVRVYDPERNHFASFNADGSIRTLFAPSRGTGYWQDQPGTDVWSTP